MTLENIVRQKLSDAEPARDRQHLRIDDPASGWNVYLTTDRRDDLSCLVWELTLRRAQDGAGDLALWADRIASQVQGLMEDLKVQEIDAVRGEGLLRSAPPTKRDDRALYFEVRLQGVNSATLRRFQGDPNGKHKREQIAFALTNETLAKLVGDVAG